MEAALNTKIDDPNEALLPSMPKLPLNLEAGGAYQCGLDVVSGRAGAQCSAGGPHTMGGGWTLPK